MNKKIDVLRCIVCVKKLQENGNAPLQCLHENRACVLIKDDVLQNEKEFETMLKDIDNILVDEKDGFPTGVKIKINSSYIDVESLKLLTKARTEMLKTIKNSNIVN